MNVTTPATLPNLAFHFQRNSDLPQSSYRGFFGTLDRVPAPFQSPSAKLLIHMNQM